MTAGRLKQAALTLFTELGYEGASLSQIAKAVGIKTPSIYAHFESKERLFLALLEDVIQEERDRFEVLAERTAGQPPLERLYAAFRFFTDLDNLSKGQAFLKRAILVPPPQLQERLRQDVAAQEAVFSAYLTGLIVSCAGDGNRCEEEEAQRRLALFYALIDGLLVEHKLYDSGLYRHRQLVVWEWLKGAVSAETASKG